MQRQKIRSFSLGVVVALALAGPVMGVSEPEALVTLRGKFTAALDRATEAMTFFWPAYKRDLAELKPKAQAAGNLEALLAIDAELKMAERMSLGKNAAYEPLKALQTNYETLRRELNQQILPEKQRLYGIYLASLQDMEVSFTKQARLDEALLVRNAVTAVQQEMKVRLPNAAPALAAGSAVSAAPQGTDAASRIARGEYAPTTLIGHTGSGGAEYKDLGKGGVLVGFEMIITPFKESNDTVRGVTPVYLSNAGETKGGTYGAERGTTSRRVVAKPGYAVGAVTVQYANLAIRRMKVRFDRINGTQLNPKDSYEAPWVGVYADTKEDTIDLGGKFPVGITGKSGKGLGCIGILYLKP